MHVGTHGGPLLLLTLHPEENHHGELQSCLCEVTDTWAVLDCEGIDKNARDWEKEPTTQELIAQPHLHSYQAKGMIGLESRDNWKQTSSKEGWFAI